jgi:hypothetical protein
MLMTEVINFREFYQKPPIIIGENDLLSIQSNTSHTEIFDGYTHWLVALNGVEIDQHTIEWKVVVFPTSVDGSVNYISPYFASLSFRTFNEAYIFSKNIESMAKQDQLFTVHQVQSRMIDL